MDDSDFEYQLQQEALEIENKKKSELTPESSKNNYIYKDPNDGMEYEWDPNKKAWFPRINEDFIAQYQASYGQTYDTTSNNNSLKKEEQIEKPNIGECTTKLESESIVQQDKLNETRKRPVKDEQLPQWFDIDDEHNTNVYVSNLPMDITEEEFINLMKKCGLIMKDDKYVNKCYKILNNYLFSRGKLKIKLYQDQMGMPKGDGLCRYIKIESVQLALNILDGYCFRDHKIKVERAKFSMKGEYDPSLKPKKKKTNKKDKEKQKRKLEKLFDWRPDKLPTERPKHEKVVVIKNMFDISIFEKDPRLIFEYKTDLKEECQEKCGTVKKVEIYDLHPDGIATVTFAEFEEADKCVELMNGRFFAGRKLDSFLWDGKTKYKIQETEEELEQRIKKWDDYLENSEDNPK